MAEIKWKTKEEIEEEQNVTRSPTIEELQTQIEQLREEKKMTDLALLELVEMILKQ